MKKKIGELGFYDIYEISICWFFKSVRYEINYDRLPLNEICEKYEEVRNETRTMDNTVINDLRHKAYACN